MNYIRAYQRPQHLQQCRHPHRPALLLGVDTSRWIFTDLLQIRVSKNATELFISVHNETLSVVTMRVSNEDRSPLAIQS
jgi:hypothetical protein